MKLRCIFGKHEREGCKCRYCNEPMHDLYVVCETIENAGGCCWSSDQPCDGPHCGYPCDNWGGTVVTVRRCRLCGKEFTS